MRKRTINIPFLGYKTHAVIYGDLAKGTPIILLHGGPGGCSEKYEVLSKIGEYNPIIFYDQFGSGYSKVPNDNKDILDINTYVHELENLISYLKIKEYILLGHSWGGMLALLFFSRSKHIGLKKLILFSTLPSTKMWNEEHLKMIEDFPISYKEAIINEYNHLPYDEKDYKSAVKYFSSNHVGKKKQFKYIAKRKRFPKLNKTVYNSLWGVNELFGTGALISYDETANLKNIDVPTLIISGKYDESSIAMNELMNKEIKNSKWVLLEHSHHCGYNEEPDVVLKAINDFLNS